MSDEVECKLLDYDEVEIMPDRKDGGSDIAGIAILVTLFLATVYGVGKLSKGVAKYIKALKLNRDAKNNLATATVSLEKAQKASKTALESLGRKKLFVLDKSISRFIASFEKLKNVQLEDSTGMDELNKFRLDEQSVAELKKWSGSASSILGGAGAGALGGALVSFGAYSAAAAFGAASTGAAIATLNGAAATNATLAFLGGGALAAGGLGVAGGTAVLGVLFAVPTLVIMGIIVDAKASKNLDIAKTNYAEAEKSVEEVRLASVLCNGIRRRSYMFERLLICLDALFFPKVFSMETIIAEKGDDWKKFDKDDKDTVAAAFSLAKAIQTVLDTPILTEDGKLTEESAQVPQEVKPVIALWESAANTQNPS
jgi:hypothetical protein